MNVFLRDKAYADLEQISDWIRRDRPNAATGVVERIFGNLDWLALFPFMGRLGIVAVGAMSWPTLLAPAAWSTVAKTSDPAPSTAATNFATVTSTVCLLSRSIQSSAANA